LRKDKDNIEKGEVSRRDFLVGAGAVVVGGAIGAGITYPLVSGKGGGEVVTTTKTVSVPTTVTATTTVGGGATTVTATTTKTVGAGETATVTVPGGTATVTTTVGGGGAVPPYLEPEEERNSLTGFNVINDVKNGKIVRSRPLHYDWKYPDIKPWTVTARGQSWSCPIKSPVPTIWAAHRKSTTSPQRILYPLKRVDWEPGGDPAKINAQNRGTSHYKRITWDEAATIVASEMRRVADKYGTSALSNLMDSGHGEGYKHNVEGFHGEITSFLQYWAYKNYGTPITDTHMQVSSYAGGEYGGQYVLGEQYESKFGYLGDICRNTNMILVWGGDIETKAWYRQAGMLQGMFYHWFHQLGIRRVYITPDLNVGAGVACEKWIPVLPMTDAALCLAVAYTWIKEDTYDKDYVATHTLGFDKWKAYVMGDEDGIQKTPKWAAPLCGIPEYTIKALAREWMCQNTTIAYGYAGGGVGRAPYSSEPIRMQYYLLAMQSWGALGRHQFSGFASSLRLAIAQSDPVPRVFQVQGSTMISAAMRKNLNIKLAGNDRNRPFMPGEYFGDCVYNPPVDYWASEDYYFKRTYPMEGASEVHFTWAAACAFTGTKQAGFRNLKGYLSPKIECVVMQHMYLEDQVFGDIILPICVQYELPNINAAYDAFTTLAIFRNNVEPIGESKGDLMAVLEVAKKADPDLYNILSDGGKPHDQLIWDRIKQGYSTSGWQDFVTWEEITEKGYFTRPPKEGWWDEKCAMYKFWTDPKASPLITPSGLLEFESQLLLENFPDDKERPPVAHWIRGGPKSEGWTHDEDLSSERAKKYPLLMCCTTAPYRFHSQLGWNPWLREFIKIKGWDGYAYEPLIINPADAAARGIENGDIVRIYNERGGILGGALVAERAVLGAVVMDKGGGYDQIIPTELNRGGNPNAICPDRGISYHCSGLAPTAYLVEVEKVTGSMMDEWRKNYPDAFTRDYGPANGRFFSGWVEEGGI
jgi:trimethylamine-N-oxide reductase (cytochrome c)